MPHASFRPDYDQELLPPPDGALGMFHRRVLGLAAAMLLVLLGLGAQLARLTISEGEARREVVSRRLDRVELLPTVRGRILDRKGRILAEDASSDELAVAFPLIDGSWAVAQAAAEARRELGRAGWSALPAAARREAIEHRLADWDEAVESMWREVAAVAGLGREQLQERLDRIRAEVARAAVAVADRREQIERQRLLEGSDRPPPPQGRIREQRQSHTVVSGLSREQAIELAGIAARFDGAVEVRHSIRRVHPWREAAVVVDGRTLPSPIRFDSPREVEVRGFADLLLGEVREQVWAEDLARRPLRGAAGLDLGGHVAGDDRIGRGGVEAAYEDRLRGRRGLLRRNLESGELERVEPVWGDDLELSLDIALQARVAALMHPSVGLAAPQQWHAGWQGGEPRPMHLPASWGAIVGAVVVLDVRTGEVLAAVSSPSPEELDAQIPRWRHALAAPGVHRALEGVYPPGSILKPLVYLAAVAARVHPADGAIECTGHYFPSLDGVARCWIYRERYGLATHSSSDGGPLRIEEALARSCNIYFYRLADRLGPSRTVEWLERFGLGRPAGLESAAPGASATPSRGEHGGFLPTAASLEELRRSGDRVTPVLLGIGQGQVAWTPLQAAHAYATIARGGVDLVPTLLRREVPLEGGRLPLDADAVARALEGLRQAVAEPIGTGHHLALEDGRRERLLDLPGLRVWGKTGTAQVAPLTLEIEGREVRLDSLEHAWFVGLVGEEGSPRPTPRYAIAVVLEHAGSGGRAAGPLAAAVVRALVDEGYLDRGEANRGGSL